MYKKYLPPTLVLILFFILIACLGIRTTDVAVFSLAAEKRVYLTFDDGPSTVVTNRVLDILKEENVKGTFFVVSDRAKTRQETLKRIAKEGHTIGIHSASHNYQKIYASDKTLLEDIDECASYIKKVTGITPSVYRFPGGGGKNKERQAKQIVQKGYRIVGWNAVCGDEEIYGANAEVLYQEVVKTSAGRNTVVLLMHDSATHKQTAEALPRIISYYRQNGYSFCAY